MKQQKKRLPIFLQLMAWILVTWFILLSFAMMLTLRYALDTFQNKVDDILLSTVKTLAESPQVLEELRDGVCSEDMSIYLTSVVDNTSDLDYITIADTNSIRLYHIDPAFIGLPFEGGDQYRHWQGRSISLMPIPTISRGSGGPSIRSSAATAGCWASSWPRRPTSGSTSSAPTSTTPIPGSS